MGRVKGRGAAADDDMDADRSGPYEALEGGDSSAGPQKSVEGWVVFVTGIHSEAQEEDLQDMFREYGTVINVNMPMDRRTGYVKGYAFVEYESKQEAQAAIENGSGASLLDETVTVDWAFSRGPTRSRASTRRRE